MASTLTWESGNTGVVLPLPTAVRELSLPRSLFPAVITMDVSLVIFSLFLQARGKHGNNCDDFCAFKNERVFFY